MLKKLFFLGTINLLFQGGITAQCLTVNCPGSTTVSSTTGSCSAVVNYSAPNVLSTCNSFTYSYTGSSQTLLVPAGVTLITMEAWGAQGGANWVNNVNYGGYAKGDFVVVPGQTLTINVGGQATSITGGFNGGGNGEGSGRGGGGGTDVRLGGTTLNDRVIVAGGGGGAGYWSSLHVVGGVGGGLVGGDGYRNTTVDAGGQGGTQTNSGTGTCVSFNNPAMSGGFGFGGNVSGCGCEGYGGGGGWYGGAGSGNCRGGGGGSGYLLPSATNTVFTDGINIGDGKVILTYSPPSYSVSTTLVSGLVSGSSFSIGTTVQTFTVTDSNNNSTSCSFSVTVNDVQTPTITCPTSFTSCTQTITSLAPVSVIDNCSASVNYTLSGATTGTGTANANGVFNLGSTAIDYQAVDLSGNSGTCSFSVFVSTIPTVTVSAPNTLICAGQSSTLSANTSSDVTSYSWTPSGSSTGSIVVTPSVTTSYSVLVNNSNACSALGIFTQSVSACTGLQENTLSFFCSVFPNPNNGSFSIDINERSDLKILNSLGQIIIERPIEPGKHSIDITSQPNGLYFISVKANDKFLIEKIIKH